MGALGGSPARSSLRPEAIKPHLAKYGPAVAARANQLFAALATDSVKQRAKLDILVGQFKDGDVRRGQAVFNSPKAACASCHQIGYLGGNIGPDLTHIGRIRTERDLLEAIVFPSASFVRGYEPVVVTTRDGRTFTGVVRKDGAEEVVLAKGPEEEVRIARDDIEHVQPGRVSIMPAGLDQQLTPRDLADLVAFLKACR
jgi:putative heme-binding domain-containing protein